MIRNLFVIPVLFVLLYNSMSVFAVDTSINQNSLSVTDFASNAITDTARPTRSRIEDLISGHTGLTPLNIATISGYPVFGFPLGRFGELNGSRNDFERLLFLAYLGIYPEVLENRTLALQAAATFLPWNRILEYIECTRLDESCKNYIITRRNDLPLVPEVGLAWVGQNEFDQDRNYRDFIAEFSNALIESVSLPIDIVIIEQVTLDTYNQNAGGFPFGIFYGPSLADGVFSGTSFQSDRSFELPSFLSMNPANAEQLLQQLDQRHAYLGTIVRLNNIRANLKTDVQLMHVALYADPQGKTKIRDFSTGLTPGNGVDAAMLSIFPSSGIIPFTASFDLTLIVEAAGRTVTSGRAILDGQDLTTMLANCVIPGTLISGGQTFRCPGLKGNMTVPGKHTLKIILQFNDHSSVSDTVFWEVKGNNEG